MSSKTIAVVLAIVAAVTTTAFILHQKAQRSHLDRIDNERLKKQQVNDKIDFETKQRVKKLLESSQFQQLKRQRTFKYDTDKYPFREIIIECLNLPSDLNFSKFHEEWEPLRGPGSFDPAKGIRQLKVKLFKPFSGLEMTPPRAKFLEVYKRFIEEIVGPAIINELYPEEDLTTKEEIYSQIVYQSFPSFRISPPSLSGPMGRPHKDSDYKHQAGQINFWLPISQAHGENSLFVESVPGKGDFEPIEADYGEAVVFYGNGCKHITKMNTTEDTRFSLDFRVVPGEAYDPLAIIQRRKDGEQLFFIGTDTTPGYYNEMQIDFSKESSGYTFQESIFRSG